MVRRSGCDGDVTYVPNEPTYRGWFDGVSNYRGTVEARGRDAVTIEVGVQGDSGYYKFGPAAVAVSPGTELSWEWTGRGGTHNVREHTDEFDSGDPVDDEGTSFEYTTDQPGTYRYLCDPHQSLGMRAAVFVALGDPGT